MTSRLLLRRHICMADITYMNALMMDPHGVRANNKVYTTHISIAVYGYNVYPEAVNAP